MDTNIAISKGLDSIDLLFGMNENDNKHLEFFDCDTDECFRQAVFYSMRKKRYYCKAHLFQDSLEFNVFKNLTNERPAYWKPKGYKKSKMKVSPIPLSKF